MPKLHLATIIGTRPEIIRLSATIKACDKYFNHTLIHTGQNYDYELNEIFFDDLGLRKPDHYLSAVGKHLGETMGNIISNSYALLSDIRPDALLILGDTNSDLAAISAKRLKIPIFHMEAGNRCFDQNVPEEINRKIVDHISDINLPYTEHSRRYLIAEGVAPKHIFVTGSPMAEVLNDHRCAIDTSDILAKLNLSKDNYMVISAHREENIDIELNFKSIISSLNSLAQTYQMPLIYSTHPRTRKKLDEMGLHLHPLVQTLSPLGFFDYNCLQKNSFVVLSDSGTLSEESAMLGFPAVLIRTSTERPEVLDRGSIVIGGIAQNEILQAVELVRSMHESKEYISAVPDYQDTNVSVKVVKLIQSYKEIINKTTWAKL